MISTAHIHWDPEYSDVKLIQTMMLVWELKKIIEETIQTYKLANTDINSIPLILCGDLNSLPDSGMFFCELLLECCERSRCNRLIFGPYFKFGDTTINCFENAVDNCLLLKNSKTIF